MKVVSSILDKANLRKHKHDKETKPPLESTPSTRRASKEPEYHEEPVEQEPTIIPTTNNPALQKILGSTGNGPATSQAVKKLWLDAWTDPVTSLNVYSPCVHTCNLYGDGEWRLVVADADKKLKVWKGTNKQSEHALLDFAVAITSFISDNTHPRLPSLAVAAGTNIYIYRNLRPYYKFVLPQEAVNPDELEIWSKLAAGALIHPQAEQALTQLQENGVVLTSRSLELLSLPDADAKATFVQHVQNQPLVQQTVITCMDTIKQAIDEPEAVSCLVVGTESGRVLVLNAAGTAVTRNIWVGAVPAFLSINGLLDVGYTITIAARDGRIYTIKNSELTDNVIQLESQAVGVVTINKNIVVGCMNDVIHSYKNRGQKNWTLYMPASILAMQALNVTAARMTKCLIVALANGEVRIYNEKFLVSQHTVPSPVSAITFGRYGREDNTLITTWRNGTLDIKILPRTANLEVTTASMGPPPEQDIPLMVPKKTRLYVEQTQREREQAVDMHCIFQRDLCKLRLTTARAYVKVLTDGQGPSAYTSAANMSVNASVQGLGPRFKVNITIKNEGQKPIVNVPVLLQYNEELYQPSKKQFIIPLLVPTLQYVHEVDVICKDPGAGSDTVRIVMLNTRSTIPFLTAMLKMPVSEMEDV